MSSMAATIMAATIMSSLSNVSNFFRWSIGHGSNGFDRPNNIQQFLVPSDTSCWWLHRGCISRSLLNNCLLCLYYFIGAYYFDNIRNSTSNCE